MACQIQGHVNRYPNLRITVKRETDERIVRENSSRTRIYYNSNYYSSKKKPSPSTRPSRSRRAELDWDYTFDFCSSSTSDSDNQSCSSV